MNLIKLEKILLVELSQPKFRLGQVKKLIFIDLIENWEEASVLSKDLRKKLNDLFPLEISAELFVSRDNKSAKALIRLFDNRVVETALMVHEGERNTVCLSSQIGCPLSCRFCASGDSFVRNLKEDEIVVQALFWARYLKKNNLGNLSNVVFMGMGEPFLNYENVFKSINVFHDPNIFDISARKISISTSGIVEGIRKMANENLKVNLAVSLHFTDDKLREIMMPIAKKYPLKRLFEAINYYIEKTNRKVMFEYMMIKGKNDSPKNAEQLSFFMSRPLYMVNIIKYNKVGGRDLSPSDDKTTKNFIKILKKNQVEVVERHRYNQDVLGACGQLGSKNS